MDNNNFAMSPTNNNTATKSPDADDFEIKTQIHGVSGGGKPLSYTNGVLKRHRPHHHLHIPPPPHHAVVVTYRECLKNHAATLGGLALDGCGEFMPSPATNPTDPTSLKCAACGCHRNFHRREPEESSSPPLQQLLLPQPLSTNASHVIEYQPHHRHHPPPPPPPPPQPPRGGSPPPQSPPPISSSYYPSSAPHMLLALSTGLSTPLPPPENHPHPQHLHRSVGHLGAISATTSNGPKRFRTKFSPMQKEKMYQLAERVGWKMQKKDEDLVAQFCKDSGVDRNVFKVWMHNNKNTFAKKQLGSDLNNATSRNSNGLSLADQITSPRAIDNENLISSHHHHSEGSENVGTHGSSSSS